MFTILITGGSHGSRTLNEADSRCLELFRKSPFRCGCCIRPACDAYERIAKRLRRRGLDGEVVPFIADMPAAFAQADLIVCRSGAGAVAELAAAGKPSILVPFPFAADQHQLKNAEAFARAGRPRWCWTGK